jgi:type I restriction enzyme S subunit
MQKRIVRSVGQLFVFAEQIGQWVKDALARVNHHTQSILAKAFCGDVNTEWGPA